MNKPRLTNDRYAKYLSKLHKIKLWNNKQLSSMMKIEKKSQTKHANSAENHKASSHIFMNVCYVVDLADSFRLC